MNYLLLQILLLIQTGRLLKGTEQTKKNLKDKLKSHYCKNSSHSTLVICYIKLKIEVIAVWEICGIKYQGSSPLNHSVGTPVGIAVLTAVASHRPLNIFFQLCVFLWSFNLRMKVASGEKVSGVVFYYFMIYLVKLAAKEQIFHSIWWIPQMLFVIQLS